MDQSQIILIVIVISFLIYLIVKRNRKETYDASIKIKTYCINRLKRQDRLLRFWDNIKANLYYSYLNIEIVSAVDKDNLEATKYHASIPGGALGCSLSHLRCLLSFLSLENENYCLIFEDDVTCGNELDRVLNVLSNNQGYDLLILGYNSFHDKENKKQCEEKDKLKICKNFTYVFGSHAYIVNRKAANYLVSNFFPIKDPYDIYFSNSEIQKNLNVGVIENNICKAVDLSDSNTV